MPARMEFFTGARNFTMGSVKFNTVQGDYHDNSVRNVRNVYGNTNRYYTSRDYSYNDHSTNYAGDYHASATHYHAPANNFRDAQNVNSGYFYGNFNQGSVPQPARGGTPPAEPSFSQYPPPPGRRPGPGPFPHDQDFTATATAVPQSQGFSQQRGPPPPDPSYRPQSAPEDNQARWQHQQQGPPPAFPPMGPQGYPQHPPQNPNFRPTSAPFTPPKRQYRQPPPQQQQQHKMPEQWPGQYAYNQGMAHLKQNSPPSWDMDVSGSSDSSDEYDSETDEETMSKAKRMEDSNRPVHIRINRGPSHQPAPDQQPQRWPRAAAVPTFPPRGSTQPPMAGLMAHLTAGGNPTRRPRDISDDSEEDDSGSMKDSRSSFAQDKRKRKNP